MRTATFGRNPKQQDFSILPVTHRVTSIALFLHDVSAVNIQDAFESTQPKLVRKICTGDLDHDVYRCVNTCIYKLQILSRMCSLWPLLHTAYKRDMYMCVNIGQWYVADLKKYVELVALATHSL